MNVLTLQCANELPGCLQVRGKHQRRPGRKQQAVMVVWQTWSAFGSGGSVLHVSMYRKAMGSSWLTAASTRRSGRGPITGSGAARGPSSAVRTASILGAR